MTAEQVWPVIELEPVDELDLLDRMPPEVEDSASAWLAWHELHIKCWERIAAEHPLLADAATYMANSHGRDVQRLLVDPANRRARHGYWGWWPTMID